MSDLFDLAAIDVFAATKLDDLKMLMIECRYVGERLQQGSMTPDEGRAFLQPGVTNYVNTYHHNADEQ
jgi:hypothetical protein